MMQEKAKKNVTQRRESNCEIVSIDSLRNLPGKEDHHYDRQLQRGANMSLFEPFGGLLRCVASLSKDTFEKSLILLEGSPEVKVNILNELHNRQLLFNSGVVIVFSILSGWALFLLHHLFTLLTEEHLYRLLQTVVIISASSATLIVIAGIMRNACASQGKEKTREDATKTCKRKVG